MPQLRQPPPSPLESRTASPTPTPSELPPVPSSPVYSVASTANPVSRFNLPPPPVPRPAHAVLTKADLERSHDAYADLVASAKAYRLGLASLSVAASAFGSALEACARLKEARAEPIGPAAMPTSFSVSAAARAACTADPLLSAAGVHHLVANHQQILSETVYRSFEVPLLHDLDRWRSVIDDEEETYQHRIRAQSREVKRLEKEGLKLHKQRRRDVARFRAHLVELTGQLDGLTTLHADHARTLLRESQETSGRIVDASCSLVRAEVDIFESLARKGWSGGGLDDLLEKGQDLFATEDATGLAASTATTSATGTATTGDAVSKLFSILPPKSILADSMSDVGLAVDGDRYQSLTDADSVFSADFNRPRNARPFSPQPIRRIPADVTFDSLGAMAAAAQSARRDANGQGHGARGDDRGHYEDDDDDNGRQGREPDEALAQDERQRHSSQSPTASRPPSPPERLRLTDDERPPEASRNGEGAARE